VKPFDGICTAGAASQSLMAPFNGGNEWEIHTRADGREKEIPLINPISLSARPGYLHCILECYRECARGNGNASAGEKTRVFCERRVNVIGIYHGSQM
jgi:hypothetical protein